MNSFSQGRTIGLDLPGYIICEELYQGFRTEMYRGWSVKRQAPVLIKTPRSGVFSLSHVSSLVHEYEVTRDLEIEGVAKAIELVSLGTTLAIVVEDTGAIPLAQYVDRKAIHIHDFLDIALRLVETLGRLHQKGIIHRGLSTDSILIHPKTKRITITGFAVEAPGTDLKSVMESVNPAYMAPEQAGLGAYGVDHRTDYYSLGVVFYQMLTGRLPLQASSPSEWISAHTTQEPAAPDAVNPKIPKTLSAVIMKMLSKGPDDRYQTSFGLIQDLRECRYRISVIEESEPLDTEQTDLRPRFALSRKLCGRQKQADALRTALEQTRRGDGGIVLVGGEAGIGKTMLVNEVLRPLAMEKGYYGYGKAGQIKQHTPYSAFVNAMEMIIKQIITDSNRNLALWKAEMLRAVGRSGAVITELFPEVEVIIGPQPQVEPLRPKEAQNRFFMVVEDFIGVFAKRGTPLVLFLDDLQWADTASLQLLKYLCRSLKYLLVIGAYRNNEVDRDHPLADFIQRAREETRVTEIHLGPLRTEEILEFVADTLYSPPERIKPLADMLERKTCGNPLFLGQALKAIYDENIIRLNERTGYWEWETKAVNNLQMPDDIVELILTRLDRVPRDTLEILRLASCLGHTFRLGPLSIICEKTISEISALLIPAMREGLVLSASEDRHDRQFEFVHDKVEQTVYSLFSETEKKRTHFRFGKLMLKEVLPDDLEDMLLPIMDHLNRGLDLVDDPGERLRLADYNLRAGHKAKSSAAYDSALSYFTAGKELLPEDAWDEYYRLCYDLHLECAQCEYMVGGTSEAERLLDILIDHAKTEYEKVDIYSMKMLLYAETGDYEKALELGIDTLDILGMPMPVRPGLLDYAKEILLYKWRMLNKGVQHLAELPGMSHSKQKKATEVLVKFILVTCTNYPDLYAFAMIKAGNHAVKHGSTEMAPIGYLGFGITEGSVLGNYAKGYELGKAAISVVERYGKSFAKCVVHFTFGAIISHWTHHLRDGLEYLRKAVDYALVAGEVLVAGWAHGVILENKYLMGTPLSEILEEAKRCSEYAGKTKHENLQLNASIYNNVASILTSWQFSEGGWDRLDFAEGDKASLATRYFCEMQLCYLKGDYTKALSIMEKEIKGCLGAVIGFMLSAECNYYHSLIITGLYPQVSSGEQKRLLRDLRKNQRQMKKWSDSCPDNFLHKYLLVEAEASRISGRKQEAELYYDKAIRSARNNGYVQDEAIACELAAVFNINREMTKVAKTYLNDACKLYRQWGAVAKIQDLRMRYPELVDGLSDHEDKGQISTGLLRNILADYAGRSTKDSNQDLEAIQEVLENVADHTDPRKALKAFLSTVTDVAYANKGYLLFERDNELFIHFARDSEEGISEITKPVPVEQTDQLSKTIVRLVSRTQETVIVDEDKLGIFAKDPYIRQAKPKSIACIPLLAQGTLIGVLYLENSFVSGIFTNRRIELVGLLANRLIHTRAPGKFLRQIDSDESFLPNETLTEREIEILRLISKGQSNKEIADTLGLTVNTVKTHIKNIYGKLQVSGRVQAVKRGKELGVL